MKNAIEFIVKYRILLNQETNAINFNSTFVPQQTLIDNYTIQIGTLTVKYISMYV